MKNKILFPSTIDHVRYINHNIVYNARRARPSYVLMPNLYDYAFMLTHETGALPTIDGVVAPDENPESTVSSIRIVTSLT